MAVLILIIRAVSRISMLLLMEFFLVCSVHTIREENVQKIDKILLGIIAFCSAAVIFVAVGM